MSTVVLDASAVLTLIHQDPGAKRVEGILSDALMSVVGMAEVTFRFHRRGMPLDLVA